MLHIPATMYDALVLLCKCEEDRWVLELPSTVLLSLWPSSACLTNNLKVVGGKDSQSSRIQDVEGPR